MVQIIHFHYAECVEGAGRDGRRERKESKRGRGEARGVTGP